MAKRITQLSELSTAAQDDYIVIVDSSTGQTRKITVKNLNGLPDITWTATGETWSYSAWNSTLKQATITVPSDATTKYQEDMFVRFSQSTGGTKYGKILSVTSTTIVVYMGSYTLNNEAISSPVYSPLASPFGVPSSIRKYSPYKFSVYRNAAWTTGSPSKVQFDAELFDSNDNFDIATNHRYTAPVDGFYRFNATISQAATGGSGFIIYLYKNGSIIAQGNSWISAAGGPWNQSSNVNKLLQLSANDCIEVYFYGTGAAGGVGQNVSYFDGFLESRG